MKNKYRIILIAVLLVPFTMIAQNSNLVVFSDSDLFYLSLNGIKQNIAPVTNIKVTDIPNESNSIYIEFADEAKGTATKNMTFLDMGVEITTKVMMDKKGRYKVKFFGEVPVSESKSTTGQFVTSYQTVNAKVKTEPTNPTTTSTITPTEKKESPQENVKTNVTEALSNNTVNNSSEKVDLKYSWTAGKVYSFSVAQVDKVTTSMMGMNMSEEFVTTSGFSIYINEVNTQGTANGIVYLTDYKVMDSKNNTLASLTDLPKKAIKSDIQIDSKGKFTFKNKLKLIKTSEGNVLTYAEVGTNSITAGGKSGNITVDAYIEFDPKSGKIKAGGSINENQSTKKVSIKVDEETNEIDVLPYDYLSMLELPTEAIQQGDKSKMTAGLYTINIEVTSIKEGNAILNYKLNTDKSNNMMDSKIESKTDSGSMMMEMPTGDMTEKMMSPDDKAMVAEAKQMTPQMSGDFKTTFNYKNGMLDLINGNMTTETKIMGMKMKVESSLAMQKN